MVESGSNERLMEEIDRLAGVIRMDRGSQTANAEKGASETPELRAAAELAMLDWSAESQRRPELRRQWIARELAKAHPDGMPRPASRAGVWAARLAVAALGIAFLFASVRLMDPAARQGWATLVVRPSATVETAGTATRTAAVIPTVPPALPAQVAPAVTEAAVVDGLPAAAEYRLGKGEVQNLAVSPIAQAIAVGSSVGVCLYDSASYAQTWCVSAPGVITQLSFDPHGRVILAGTQNGWLEAWETDTSRPIFRIQPSTAMIRDLTWAPDGRCFAVATGAGDLQIRDSQRGEAMQSLPNPSGEILALAWAPDGQRLAAADSDQSVTLWDVAAGISLRTLTPNPSPLGVVRSTHLAWSADGQIFVGTGFSQADRSGQIVTRGRLDLWDESKAELTKSLPVEEIIAAMALSSDGSRLAVTLTDGSTAVWDTHAGKQLASVSTGRKNSTALAWAADEKSVLLVNRSGQVATWETLLPQTKQVIAGYTGPVKDVAWSPDGKLLAVSHAEGQLSLWDPGTGALVHTWDGDPSHSLLLAWKPSTDAQLLAVGGENVVVWNMATENPVIQLPVDVRQVSALAWSPKGWQLAAGGATGEVVIWEANSGQELRQIHTGHAITSVAWSPDEQTLAAAWSDGSAGGVNFYAVSSGDLLGTIDAGTAVERIAWSPDGSQLGTLASGYVEVWDPATRQHAFNLGTGHAWGVESFAWSMDGKRLASGDGEIFVWDMRSRRKLVTLSGQTEAIVSLSFRPDGKGLASGSQDGTVLVWDLTK